MREPGGSKLLRAGLLASGVGAAVAMGGPLVATSVALPADMAYEKVSPAQKGDANIGFQARTVTSSVSGERVAFRSGVAFADAEGASFPTEYIAERRGQQWVTFPITPPQDPDLAGAQLGLARGYHAFSPDLRRGVVAQKDPVLVPGAAAGVMNLYGRNLPPATPADALLTPPPLAPRDDIFFDVFEGGPAVAAVSDRVDRVVFESRYALVPGAVERRTNVYEWVDGETRLVSVLPGGEAPDGDAMVGAGARPNAPWDHAAFTDRAVSDDGAQIVYTVGSGGEGRIYVRRRGGEPREVTASQASTRDPLGPAPARFMTASRDGSQIFFRSCEKLTDGAAASCDSPIRHDLYRYDVATGELVDMTKDDATLSVEGLIGADDDGAHLYLIGIDKRIRHLHPGGIRVVPPSSYAGEATKDQDAGDSVSRQSEVSREGRYLVFSAETNLQPRIRDLYLYDGANGTTRCLSCDPTGAASTTVSTLRVNTPGDSEGLTSSPPTAVAQTPRNIDVGGRYIFFNSANALVPEDENGRTDVYRYEIATGNVALISTGNGTRPAFFTDASADGSAVFFATANPVIDGLDDDDFVDLYVARVGATPYVAPPSATECTGSACQGPLFLPGLDPAPGSALFVGPGDVDETATPRRVRVVAIAAISPKQRRAWVRRGRTNLKAKVSDPGRLVATASARIGRKMRIIARAHRTVRGGGAVTMRLTLSPAARRHLRARGRLSVKIVVRYVGGGGSQARSLVLRTTRGGRR